MSRNYSLDVARGIGICLVVLGHTLTYDNWPSRFIFTFHMPLFFVISGMLYSRGKIEDFNGKYMSAYLFFLLLSVVKLPFDSSLLPSSWGGVCRMLWGCFVHCHPTLNGPLWFLVTLTMCRMVFACIDRGLAMSSRRRILGGIFLLGVAVAALYCARLPFAWRRFYVPYMVTNLPLALFFYACGCWLRPKLESLLQIKAPKIFLLFGGVLALVILLFVTRRTEITNLSVAQIGTPFGFLYALLGVAMIFILVNCINGNVVASMLSYIGRNSLCFFAMEFITIFFVSRFLSIAVPALTDYKPTARIPLQLSMLLFVVPMFVLSLLTRPIGKVYKLTMARISK